MDIIPHQIPVVILNLSIESHLLDVAITRQPPKIANASQKNGNYIYEITGLSCIAGDVMGRYHFKEELQIGDKLYFEDMIAYSMVKQTSFNGLKEAHFIIR